MANGPWPPVNLETFDLLRGYPVALNQVGQRGIMCPGGRHGLALEPFARPTCTWIMSLLTRLHREDGSHFFYVKPQGLAATS
ncbi:Uncharacterized protein HZ326_27633 [Fusarium oxysporum f. sp. albedinis]|nr:Uncharacterized protein HZ326_27633 [Fusarium oxysporum f. sp. albedinis]